MRLFFWFAIIRRKLIVRWFYSNILRWKSIVFWELYCTFFLSMDFFSWHINSVWSVIFFLEFIYHALVLMQMICVYFPLEQVLVAWVFEWLKASIHSIKRLSIISKLLIKSGFTSLFPSLFSHIFDRDLFSFFEYQDSLSS